MNNHEASVLNEQRAHSRTNTLTEHELLELSDELNQSFYSHESYAFKNISRQDLDIQAAPADDVVNNTEAAPSSVKPLTDDELLQFYNELEKDEKGYVTLHGIETRWEEVYQEFSPTPSGSHGRQWWWTEDHAGEPDLEAQDPPRGLGPPFANGKTVISKEDFFRHVRSWNVPSPVQNDAGMAPRAKELRKDQLSFTEQLRVRWLVEGSRFVMISFIIFIQFALGAWQMVKYLQSPEIRMAFGWGVILSKTAAGAIYPTMFFLLLSMSRYFATLLRRFKHLPRLVNWDRSQSTHVWMALVGLLLATLHAIGYLAGSFPHSTRPGRHELLEKVIGQPAPRTYTEWLQTLPGWSGLTALGLYYVIALLSLPAIRRRSYETFQVSHLLMFPFLGLLCAHGTSKLLQYPMLGFWLAFPLFLILFERSSRLAHGLRRVPAQMSILDEDTVTITFNHPRGNWWNYEAGQYIFLQVPSISFFQWHPFTVSACAGPRVQVHIRTQGSWARRLRSLPTDRDIRIGVDGPFGAPAQRFYEFDRALVIGAGVGITPFSAIMTDLEQKLGSSKNPWVKARRLIRAGSATQDSTEILGMGEDKADAGNKTKRPISFQRSNANSIAPSGDRTGSIANSFAAGAMEHQDHPARRIDFHWMAREKEDFQWFAALLNRAYDLSLTFPPTALKLSMKTYITTRRRDISTHIFRYLLDSYRSPAQPYSTLTGLKIRSAFGRPDLTLILEEFDQDLRRQGWTGGRVGVFFCGSPSLGRVLADSCAKLTSRGRQDGSKTRYIFMMEVFG